jgi:predicted MPP superfamily phosphohydrolase
MHTLAALLGVAQVLIGHWVIVVLAEREGPGWALGLVLGGCLIAANLMVARVLRPARSRGGWPRRLASLYTTIGVGTLLLSLAVVFSWIGILPLAALLTAVGVDGETAFSLFRIASGVVVLGLAGMILWGFTGGQASFDRTRVRVTIPDLHDDHRGLRIAQLSDLHIGNGLEDGRLERLVRETNALEADLITLTGDIFDFDPRYVEGGARILAGLRARLGVYAVLGNHDTYTGSEIVAEAITRHAPHWKLLRGEVVALPAEPPIYVAGVDDPGRGANWTNRNLHLDDLERLGSVLPSDGPVLLLVHRPEAFPQAARLGFPLVLAGHTHGGQMALPIPGGRFNLARLMTPFHRGRFELNGSTLYVNRGAGMAGPAIRFNCSREIATIELV